MKLYGYKDLSRLNNIERGMGMDSTTDDSNSELECYSIKRSQLLDIDEIFDKIADLNCGGEK